MILWGEVRQEKQHHPLHSKKWLVCKILFDKLHIFIRDLFTRDNYLKYGKQGQ